MFYDNMTEKQLTYCKTLSKAQGCALSIVAVRHRAKVTGSFLFGMSNEHSDIDLSIGITSDLAARAVVNDLTSSVNTLIADWHLDCQLSYGIENCYYYITCDCCKVHVKIRHEAEITLLYRRAYEMSRGIRHNPVPGYPKYLSKKDIKRLKQIRKKNDITKRIIVGDSNPDRFRFIIRGFKLGQYSHSMGLFFYSETLPSLFRRSLEWELSRKDWYFRRNAEGFPIIQGRS
jgi:hypothetical protein